MNLVRCVSGLAAIWMLASSALGAEPGIGLQDDWQWLQRISQAAQKLSYSGTFVYRNGLRSETSRIVHTVSQGRQLERLEVLDGSPREVIRRDEEVKCYLPEERRLIIEQRSTRRTFPSLLPMSIAGLGAHYALRSGGTARIAGHESRIIRIEPRDGWRYGHQFWVDTASGLLLKAEVFDSRGEVMESLAFTELQIGEPDPALLASRHAPKGEVGSDWQVRQARLKTLREDAAWQFRHDLPGFRREAAMRRSFSPGQGETNEVLHWVYSDGLAALSVFIAPSQEQATGPKDERMSAQGALSIARRHIEGYQVVVLGDLPPAAIKHFADGIRWVGK